MTKRTLIVGISAAIDHAQASRVREQMEAQLGGLVDNVLIVSQCTALVVVDS